MATSSLNYGATIPHGDAAAQWDGAGGGWTDSAGGDLASAELYEVCTLTPTPSRTVTLTPTVHLQLQLHLHLHLYLQRLRDRLLRRGCTQAQGCAQLPRLAQRCAQVEE